MAGRWTGTIPSAMTWQSWKNSAVAAKRFIRVCREEHGFLPLVTQAGLPLIGINYKDRPEDAKAWLAELGDPYKTIAVDARGRTGIDFGVYGVPETYLIDKQGVIRKKWTGPLTPDVIRDELIPLAEKLK